MGLSIAGEHATKALADILRARRDCVDPAELERINRAITALHEVVEPDAHPVPALTLRADDRLALLTLAHYAKRCLSLGLHRAAGHVGRVSEEFDSWQKTNPQMMKLPDAPDAV